MSASEKLKALETQKANREYVTLKHEHALWAALPQIVAVVEALEAGWPKSVLVDRDGTNEEMVAFPLAAWWPVRDALSALEEALS